MRAKTQKRIDALHAEIAELVKKEKAHHRKQNPGTPRLMQQIAECRIEVAAWSPSMKAGGRTASATPPPLHNERLT